MRAVLVVASLTFALSGSAVLAQSVVDLPSEEPPARERVQRDGGDRDRRGGGRPDDDRPAREADRHGMHSGPPGGHAMESRDEDGVRDRRRERGADHKSHWRMAPGDGADRPARAARFRIDDGRARIDLRCPDEEPMRECADVLLQIIDRMQNRSVGERDFDAQAED